MLETDGYYHMRLKFSTEKEARAYLESLLAPYFALWPEVPCTFEGHVLRIDYVAAPKPSVQDFPFSWFGIEVKRGIDGKREGFSQYTKGVQQAIDYTNCAINGHRIGVVFVFPGLGDGYGDGMSGGVNRLAGRFRVGTIRLEMWNGVSPMPRFEMCADRLWDPRRGVVANPPKHHLLAATRR